MCDATCLDSLALSYDTLVAEEAEKKCAKYAH